MSLTRRTWLQISGAMVKMSDAPRGVSERMLRLTGFPEQVQAAMNLVQVCPRVCMAAMAAQSKHLHGCWGLRELWVHILDQALYYRDCAEAAAGMSSMASVGDDCCRRA